MRKILTIAVREYRAMVGTKAFLISIIMMPVLMMGGLIGIELLRNAGEIKERKIAVIDHDGRFFDFIQGVAEQRNKQIDQQADDAEEDSSFLGSPNEKYLFERADVTGPAQELKLELSNRIRNQDLYAFFEIPKFNRELDIFS